MPKLSVEQTFCAYEACINVPRKVENRGFERQNNDACQPPGLLRPALVRPAFSNRRMFSDPRNWKVLLYSKTRLTLIRGSLPIL